MQSLILSQVEGSVQLTSISPKESYLPTKELLYDFFLELGFVYERCSFLVKKKRVTIEIKPTYYFLSEIKEGKKICKLNIEFKNHSDVILEYSTSIYPTKDRGGLLKKLWAEIHDSYQKTSRIISELEENKIR